MRPACRRTDEAGERFVEIGERRRQAPDTKPRRQAAQSRECELDLNAALRRHQLVPFVDDDSGDIREALAPIFAREEQRQAFGRGNERARQSPLLPRARRRRCVAGAHVDGPMRLQCGRGACERKSGVLRKRAQRRQPQHGQRWRVAGGAGGPEHERAKPCGVGLPHAGGRVDQAGFTARVGTPHGALERERRVAKGREPPPGRGVDRRGQAFRIARAGGGRSLVGDAPRRATDGLRRQSAATATFATVITAGAPRNRSSSAASRAFASFRWRSFTWP